MINELNEQIKVNRLLDLYGRLLTSAQLEIMKDYYELNLSLSEISENRNISRTAVSDAIKKARKNLENYEEKIGICAVIDSFSNEDETKKEVAKEVESRIKYGI